MALPADFDKIFGETFTGGITPIADVDYSKGWEFVGNNPPTKNDFSYLQNLSDIKSQWLYDNKLNLAAPFAEISAAGTQSVARANLGLGTAATKNVGVSSGQIPDMSFFNNQKTDTGYQNLPGGVVIQWGVSSTNASPGTVAFPVSFPNRALVVIATDQSVGGPGQGFALTTQVYTSSNFQLRAYQTGTNSESSIGAGGFAYIAIGY